MSLTSTVFCQQTMMCKFSKAFDIIPNLIYKRCSNNSLEDQNNGETAKTEANSEKKVPKRKHEAPPEMNEDGTLPCKHCDVTIKGVTKWRVHMRQHRKDMRMRAQYKNPPTPNEDGKYPCQECETEFENLTKWKLHMKEHRRGFQPKRPYNRRNPDGTTKSYKCEYCEKGKNILLLFVFMELVSM